MKPIIVPKPVLGFQAQTLDGEIVLLHPVNNLVIHINETGALVWQLCDGVRATDEIVEILSAAYPDAEAEIAADVPQVIEQLAVQGALYKE